MSDDLVRSVIVQYGMEKDRQGVFMPSTVWKRSAEKQKSLDDAVTKLFEKPKTDAGDLTDDDFSIDHAHALAQPVRSSRAIQIFSTKALSGLSHTIAGTSNKDIHARLDAAFRFAARDGGYRDLPDFRGIDKKLNSLSALYQNFLPVLQHYENELRLATHSRPDRFHVSPVLLDGLPGIGKTAFAQALAGLFDMPFRKISAGGMQHASAITGASGYWSTAQTGEVFNMLARGNSASGILLIDEVDKMSDRPDHAILPALLDLLERESSRRYVEESLRLEFDASRLIIIMTSNRKDLLDSALLSRCQVFDIDLPDVVQKRLIALNIHDSLNEGLMTRYRIKLDRSAVDRLITTEIDTRALIQAVRVGFMRALKTGDRVSVPDIPAGRPRSRGIGFMPNN